MVTCSSFSALGFFLKFGNGWAENLLIPNWGFYLCLIKPLFKKRFSLVKARFAHYSQRGDSIVCEIKTAYLKFFIFFIYLFFLAVVFCS